MNTQRIMAIFEKDMKDFTKNMMTLFTPIMPILLAALYRRMNTGGEAFSYEMVYIIVGVTLSTVTTGLLMMNMAEEKEKNTLRGLMMSPASFTDIIIGKSLVTTFITLVTYVLSLYLLDGALLMDFSVLFTSLLLFVFFLFLGIGIGLFVKTVGATTIYMMPIMLLFGFTPMFSNFGLEKDHIVMKITDWFPIMAAMDYSVEANWQAVMTMLAWIVVAGVFAFICFVQTRKDR